MDSLKRWKNSWELKSLNREDVFKIIVEIIVKQLEEIPRTQIKLGDHLVDDYDADSVDIVAMLLSLEDLFKTIAEKTRTRIPTNKLGQIIYVEDLFDITYEVLMEVESKIDPNEIGNIKPDFAALEKKNKVGEFYSKPD